MLARVLWIAGISLLVCNAELPYRNLASENEEPYVTREYAGFSFPWGDQYDIDNCLYRYTLRGYARKKISANKKKKVAEQYHKCRPPPIIYDEFEGSSQCQTLPTKSRDFAVSVCHNIDQCRFNTTIIHHQCVERPTPGKVSYDPIHEERLVKIYGPDVLRVRLDGPEVVMIEMQYLGNCVYQGSASLSLQGWFTFQVELLYVDFMGISETQYDFEQIYTRLTDKHRFELGCQGGQPFVVGNESLPKCNRQQAGLSEGRFVRPAQFVNVKDRWPGWIIDNYEGVEWRHLPVYNVLSFYNWGSRSVWKPLACRLQEPTEARYATCLKGQVVSFYGDSLTRTAFYGLLYEVGYEKKGILRKMVKGATVEVQHSGITIRYHPNVTQSLKDGARICDHGRPLTLVFAQSLAYHIVQRRGNHSWIMSQYDYYINRLRRILKSCNSTSAIWHSSPAPGHGLMLRQTSWFSPQKVNLLRVEAQKRVQVLHDEFGDRVLFWDMFKVTYPMNHLPDDGLHYFDSTWIWKSQLFTMLCSRAGS